MSACVVDSDVIIAALDRSDPNHRRATKLIAALADSSIELLVSSVNYAEVLVRPAADPEDLKAAIMALSVIGLRVIPPPAQVARAAASHRAHGKISLPDGFALATAEARTAALATFDRRLRKRTTEAGVSLQPPRL